MKKIIALLLSALMLLTGCSVKKGNNAPAGDDLPTFPSGFNTKDLTFTGLSDPDLIQYVEDNVYANLVNDFESDDYKVETVRAVYLSKEYLEEKAYNSLDNNYFGYTLAELDQVFGDTKYIFTVDENGQTVVQEMQTISEKDIMNQIIKNVAIGAGVILICVVVTVVTKGAGLATVTKIFAASAKTAAIFAAKGAVISGASAGIVKAYQTGDIKEALKSTAVGASEGFKWGAITGAVTGGVGEAIKLKADSFAKSHNKASSIRTPSESEAFALEKYGGNKQISYLNGQLVPYGTADSTRPDIVRILSNGQIEAIEVKNYDLINNSQQLVSTLKTQVASRVKNLPEGFVQRIVLDVNGRGYSEEFVESVISYIKNQLIDINPTVIIETLG